jgi:hypothetical protein
MRDTVGDCDCCGKRRVLSFVHYPPVGDTWACGECQSAREFPELSDDDMLAMFEE